MDWKVKCILSLFFLLRCLSGTCQCDYETELYTCIKDKFKDNGHDIELGLDSFETQLIELGHLSDSLNLPSLLEKEARSGMPLIIKSYIPSVDIRTNSYKTILNTCFDKKNHCKLGSKYFKLAIHLSSTETDGRPWSILEATHSIINESDYAHPFYRMSALITLHAWSLESSEN